MPKCPNCGADVSELVPERCRGCPLVQHWRRRAEATTLELERCRMDWRRLDDALRHVGRLQTMD